MRLKGVRGYQLVERLTASYQWCVSIRSLVEGRGSGDGMRGEERGFAHVSPDNIDSSRHMKVSQVLADDRKCCEAQIDRTDLRLWLSL